MGCSTRSRLMSMKRNPHPWITSTGDDSVTLKIHYRILFSLFTHGTPISICLSGLATAGKRRFKSLVSAMHVLKKTLTVLTKAKELQATEAEYTENKSRSGIIAGSCYKHKSLFIFKLHALLRQAMIQVVDEVEIFSWFSFASSVSLPPLVYF